MIGPSIFDLPPVTHEEELMVRALLNVGDMISRRDSRIEELEAENEDLRRDLRKERSARDADSLMLGGF